MNALCRSMILLLGFSFVSFAQETAAPAASPAPAAAQQGAAPAPAQKDAMPLAAPLAAPQSAPQMHVSSDEHLEGALPKAQGQPGALTLNVVVTDKAGNLVSGLTQRDFTVLEDKQPQPIQWFRAMGGAATGAASGSGAPPTEVILVVDTVNTGVLNVSRERQEINKFLRSNGGKLPEPVTLVVFADTRTQVLNQPSRDGIGLAASLKASVMAIRFLNRSAGFDGAVEQFQLSMQTIQRVADFEAGKPGRKLVVWVGPGWPYLSGPQVNLTMKEQKALYDSLVSLLGSLRRADIALYSVDPLGTDDAGTERTEYFQGFLDPVTSPKRMDAAYLSLQVVAVHSGGLALNSSNDVAGEIARCVRDASGFYELSVPPVAAGQPDQYHSVDVKLATPGLIARTISGYYGHP